MDGALFRHLTIGELYLSPISMSLYSKVAPLRIASLMMAVNFLPNFLGGGFLQGWLGTYWTDDEQARILCDDRRHRPGGGR